MQKKVKTAVAVVCLTAAASIWLLSGCARKIEPITKSSFMLNTFVTVTLYDTDDPDILNGSLELCRSYENIFSRTIEASEIYKLNHRPADEQTVTVSDDVAHRDKSPARTALPLKRPVLIVQMTMRTGPK